jgi:DNA-binding transcriptional ArsR family regulator
MDAITQERGLEPDSGYVEQAAEIFGMLADPTRVRLIVALADSGELSVNHLADIVDKTPAAVSQHLAKLRLARVVTNRRQGTTIFYALADEHAIDLVRNAVLQAEHSFDPYPRHHRNESD